MANVVANVAMLAIRNLGNQPTTTAIPPSSTAASAPTAAATLTPSQSAGANQNQSSPQSSPLLFFVALGFGVVFTNLWIIVGVKYCFRYNARNRLPRDENGEIIDLNNMPRQSRRRREKKLMTMDEVNERFPMTKYKAWMTSRAAEGLSTAGGVASPPSRPASMHAGEGQAAESKSSSLATRVLLGPTASHIDNVNGNEKSPEPTSSQVSDEPPSAIPPTSPTRASATLGARSEAHDTKTIASTVPGDDGDDDDDQEGSIRAAGATDLLTTPGDTCAICLDTLEDDDDVRGLTCGHTFHAGCLDPWLTSRRACCPLCKADYYIPKPRPTDDAAAGTDPASTAAGANGPTDLAVLPAGSRPHVRGSIFHPRNFMPTRYPLRAESPPRARSAAPPRFQILTPWRRESRLPTGQVVQPVVATTPASGPEPMSEQRSAFSWNRLPRFGARRSVRGVEQATPAALEAGVRT